jgi:phosphomannomutase
VIHPGLQHTRDALAATALILQHLLDEGNALSAAASRWPSYVIVKEKLSFPRSALRDAYAALVEGLPPADTDTSDGLRLAWTNRRAWLHVRPSGTEPVVRLIAEAPEAAEARDLVQVAAERLQGIARG